MTPRTIGFVVFALVVAGLCVTLGFWQLDRLAQRRAMNESIRAPLNAPPQPFESVRHLGESARFRRVMLRGVADYANERVHASRTRNGSPGVHILTPVRLLGADHAVFVNRGWVYAPDAMNVDLARWREGDTLDVVGFVDVFTAQPRVTAGAPARPLAGGARLIHRLTSAAAIEGLPYAVAPMIVVATELRSLPPTTREAPPRLAPPDLAEGPHMGYAIQWFAFASIAVIGVAAILLRSRRGRHHWTPNGRARL